MPREGVFALCVTRVGISGRYMTTGQSIQYLVSLRKHWCAIPGLNQRVIPFAYGAASENQPSCLGTTPQLYP